PPATRRATAATPAPGAAGRGTGTRRARAPSVAGPARRVAMRAPPGRDAPRADGRPGRPRAGRRRSRRRKEPRGSRAEPPAVMRGSLSLVIRLALSMVPARIEQPFALALLPVGAAYAVGGRAIVWIGNPFWLPMGVFLHSSRSSRSRGRAWQSFAGS